MKIFIHKISQGNNNFRQANHNNWVWYQIYQLLLNYNNSYLIHHRNSSLSNQLPLKIYIRINFLNNEKQLF